MPFPVIPVPLSPEFARRVERITTTRATRVRSPATPKARSRAQSGPQPLTRLCLLLATCVALRIILFASVGAAPFAERADRMAQGNWAEQAAAWVIQPDHLTLAMQRDVAQFIDELPVL